MSDVLAVAMIVGSIGAVFWGFSSCAEKQHRVNNISACIEKHTPQECASAYGGRP